LSPPLPLTLSQLGGMGFISVAECEVLRNNALINIHMAHTAAEMGVPRYFFSSSQKGVVRLLDWRWANRNGPRAARENSAAGV